MHQPSGSPRAAALHARLLFAALAFAAPAAEAQTSGPFLSPGSATLEAASLGASATERFAVDAPAGVDSVVLCVDTCSDGDNFVETSGILSDGQSTWRLDAANCAGADCDVFVEYTAGDERPRNAQLLVFDGNDGTATAALTGTLAPPRPDPEPGEAVLAIGTGSVTEGGPPLRIVVERRGGSDGRLSAFFGTEDIDATEGVDYTVSPAGPLVWENGDTTSRTVTVTARADAEREPAETFEFLLARRGDDLDQSAEITILDATPDPEPGRVEFVATRGSVTEGGTLDVQVRRVDGDDGAFVAFLGVDVGTGTGRASRADFRIVAPADGALRWAAGADGVRTITVEAVADEVLEDDETFAFLLASDGNGERFDQSSEVTILDATEPPRPGRAEFASARDSVAEGARLDVVVERVDGSDGPLQVDFALESGSADTADYRLVAPTGGTLRWIAGDTSARTITVEALGDARAEPDETFTVRLADAGNDGVGPASEITITDVPPEPDPEPGTVRLAEAAYTVAENAGPVVLTVTRSGGSDGAAVVNYRLADGTATAGADYGVAATAGGRLRWADGDAAPKSITVPIVDGATLEPDETFTVTLSLPPETTEASGPRVALGEPSRATVTIVDVSAPDTVAFARASETVAEGAGTLDVAVRRLGDGAGAASIGYRIVAGSATATSDYRAAATGRIAWPAGDTETRTLAIPIVDDGTVEDEERFSIVLEQPVGLELGEPATTAVTIVDDDVAGTLAFDPARYAVTEADGTVTLSVARTGGSAGPATVRWQAVDGAARAGEDYARGANAARSGTLSWAAGAAGSRGITLPIATDALVEEEEDFTVTLSAPTGAALGEITTGTVLIGDSTPIPLDRIAFAVAERRAAEGGGTARLLVRRIGDGRGAATVRYTVAPDTASRGDLGADVALSGTLSWAANDTGDRAIDLAVVDDELVEGDERVLVALDDVEGAVIGSPASSVLVIVDDDVAAPAAPGTLRFTVDAPRVDEDAGEIVVGVERVGGTDGVLTVNAATADDGARAGRDYTPVATTLRWNDGEDGTRFVTVPILSDDELEDDERFLVRLADASAAGEPLTPDVPEAAVTIVDASVAPLDRLAFAAAALEIGESGGSARLVVRREGAGRTAASVRYAIELDDGAPAGAATTADLGRGLALEGTLSWAAGDTGERTIVLPLVDDTLVEPDERFTIRLNRPDGAVLGSPDAATVTIVDDDVPPPLETGSLRFAVADPSVEESAGEIVVGVERVGGTDGAASVAIATVDAGAVAGRDYTGVDTTLRWEDGEDGTRFVTVPILADAEREDDERFLVRLGSATAAGEPLALASSEIAVTIVDTTRVGTLVLSDTRVEVIESAGEILVAISRTGGSDGPMQVSYETLVDPESAATTRTRDLVPATAFDDFGSASGTLSWADGEDGLREARIPIVDDALDEPDETLRLRFFDALPAGTLVSGSGEVGVTIIDDDEPFVPGDPTIEPLDELGSLRLVVASGNGQSGLPGDILEPMLADAVDAAAGNRTVPNVPVRWIVRPAGSALLLEGERTVSGGDGSVRNRVRVRSRGFLDVIAVIDVADPPPGAEPDGTAPGEALFLVRAGIATQPDLSENQIATGNALDTLCETLGARIENGEALPDASLDLFATCTELDARVADDDARLGASLERLAPEELFAIGDSVIDTTDIQVTNVYARINAIRAARRGRVDLSGLDLDVYGERIPGSVVGAAADAWAGRSGPGGGEWHVARSRGNGAVGDGANVGHGGGGASGDEDGPGSRLGVFVNGTVSVGEIDGAGNQRDADVSTAGVTVGVDYRFTANTVAGMGLGLVVNETAFGANDGSVDLDGLALTLFATRYSPDAGYVDGVLEIGRNTYDVRRRINLPGLADQFGLGETDADVLSATIGAGKDFRTDALEFGPYFRLSHTRASVSGYTERAAFDAPGAGSVLEVRAHDVSSTRLAIGGQLSRTINTRRGVLVPQLRLETEIENEERKDGIAASFRHDPDGVPFTVNGNPRDTEGYVNLGLGGSAVFANGRSGYLFYETRAGHEYVTQHWLKAGFRLEF